MARKLIVVIIILGLIWSSIIYTPKTNAAGVVHDPINAIFNSTTAVGTTSQVVKDYVLKPIVRALARKLLSDAVSGIINKIQTGGRDGGPAFVQNWRNFQADSQYRGEDTFRAILSNTTLCNDIDGNIKNLFGATKKRIIPIDAKTRMGNLDPYQLRANCTMPSNFSTANYQRDFSGNGGWNAWSRMLEPQNNYYGVLFQSLDEVGRQRGPAPQSADINEALAGNGYTSIQDGCKDQFAGTNNTGPTLPSQARCTFMGQIFTPGDLLGKSAASTIDNDLGWLVSSQEIGSIVISIATALTNRLANLATSNPARDYDNAPKADTSRSGGYLACLNSCPAGTDLSCQNNCAKAWGNYSPPSADCTKVDCSTTGDGGVGVPPPEDALEKHPDQSSVVAAVKSQLESAGADLSGSCGAFKITKNVAWQLKASGAGLLSKPGGTNCDGYSTDIIAFPDGYIYDILGDAGRANTPRWGADGCGPLDGNGTCPDRYVAAFDPGGGGATNTIRSDFTTCTKGSLGRPSCDIVLNYIIVSNFGAEIKKNGVLWRTKNDIGLNSTAGTQVDANPAPGTYTYALFGFKADGTESLSASVTVTIK